MSDQTPGSPAAGWYPDPDAPQGQRYWDGQRWTEHRQAAVPQQTAPVHGASSTPAASSGASWALPVGLLFVGLVVGGVLGFGLGSASSTSGEPTASEQRNNGPTPSDTGQADQTDDQTSELVVAEFSLKGDGNTEAVELPAGDYSATWQTGGSCYYGVDLEPVNGGPFSNHSLFTADNRTDGEQNVYGVKAGRYYVSAITGPAPSCPWSVTLRQVG